MPTKIQHSVMPSLALPAAVAAHSFDQTFNAQGRVPRLIPIPEALHITCLGKTKFYDEVKNGELHIVKLGRKSALLDNDCYDYVNRRVQASRKKV